MAKISDAADEIAKMTFQLGDADRRLTQDCLQQSQELQTLWQAEEAMRKDLDALSHQVLRLRAQHPPEQRQLNKQTVRREALWESLEVLIHRRNDIATTLASNRDAQRVLKLVLRSAESRIGPALEKELKELDNPDSRSTAQSYVGKSIFALVGAKRQEARLEAELEQLLIRRHGDLSIVRHRRKQATLKRELPARVRASDEARDRRTLQRMCEEVQRSGLMGHRMEGDTRIVNCFAGAELEGWLEKSKVLAREHAILFPQLLLNFGLVDLVRARTQDDELGVGGKEFYRGAGAVGAGAAGASGPDVDAGASSGVCADGQGSDVDTGEEVDSSKGLGTERETQNKDNESTDHGDAEKLAADSGHSNKRENEYSAGLCSGASEERENEMGGDVERHDNEDDVCEGEVGQRDTGVNTRGDSGSKGIPNKDGSADNLEESEERDDDQGGEGELGGEGVGEGPGSLDALQRNGSRELQSALHYTLYRFRCDPGIRQQLNHSRSGYLEKVSRWRVYRRWFVWDAATQQLSYYFNPRDKIARRIYWLTSECVIKALNPSDPLRRPGSTRQAPPVGRIYFHVGFPSLQNGESELLLACSNVNQRMDWLRALWLSGCYDPRQVAVQREKAEALGAMNTSETHQAAQVAPGAESSGSRDDDVGRVLQAQALRSFDLLRARVQLRIASSFSGAQILPCLVPREMAQAGRAGGTLEGQSAADLLKAVPQGHHDCLEHSTESHATSDDDEDALGRGADKHVSSEVDDVDVSRELENARVGGPSAEVVDGDRSVDAENSREDMKELKADEDISHLEDRPQHDGLDDGKSHGDAQEESGERLRGGQGDGVTVAQRTCFMLNERLGEELRGAGPLAILIQSYVQWFCGLYGQALQLAQPVLAIAVAGGEDTGHGPAKANTALAAGAMTGYLTRVLKCAGEDVKSFQDPMLKLISQNQTPCEELDKHKEEKTRNPYDSEEEYPEDDGKRQATQPELAEQCRATLATVLFEMLYAPLFALFVTAYATQERRLVAQVQACSTLSARRIGLTAELCLPPDNDGRDAYADAIDELRLLSTLREPVQKLQCIVRVSQVICACVDRVASAQAIIINADDLLLLFAYIIVKAEVPCLSAELAFTEQFMPPDHKVLMTGYYLATAQAATELILSDDLAAEEPGNDEVGDVAVEEQQGQTHTHADRPQDHQVHSTSDDDAGDDASDGNDDSEPVHVSGVETDVHQRVKEVQERRHSMIARAVDGYISSEESVADGDMRGTQ